MSYVIINMALEKIALLALRLSICVTKFLLHFWTQSYGTALWPRVGPGLLIGRHCTSLTGTWPFALNTKKTYLMQDFVSLLVSALDLQVRLKATGFFTRGVTLLYWWTFFFRLCGPDFVSLFALCFFLFDLEWVPAGRESQWSLFLLVAHPIWDQAWI